MPRLGRTVFQQTPIPSGTKDGENVWVCETTNEAFSEYSEFAERAYSLTERLWTCTVSGKSNLNFLEALLCEKVTSSKLQESFPHTFEQPVSMLLHGASKGSMDLIASVAFTKLSQLFYESEPVDIPKSCLPDVPCPTHQSMLKGVVRRVMVVPKFLVCPHLQPAASKKPPAKVEDEDSDVDHDSSSSPQSNKENGSTDKMQETNAAIEEEEEEEDSMYEVEILGKNGGYYEIPGYQLRRKKKGGFSREMLKLFIRENTVKILTAKQRHTVSLVEPLRTKYNLPEIKLYKPQPKPVRAPPPPKVVGPSKRDLAAAATAAKKAQQKKERQVFKVNPDWTEAEKKLAFIQHKKNVLRMNVTPKIEARIKELQGIIKEEAKVKRAAARKILLEKQKAETIRRRLAKVQEEKEAKAREIERMRPREDLTLDDLKELPSPTELKLLVPSEITGDALAISEWLRTFTADIDLSRQVPHKISYEEFEGALLECDHTGLLCDLVLHLMVVLFETEATVFDDWGPTLKFESLPLDSFTLTEVLRMYILSDPKNEEGFGSPTMLEKMKTEILFNYDVKDKVHILEFLGQQILGTSLGSQSIKEAEERMKHLNSDWRETISIEKASKQARRDKKIGLVETIRKKHKQIYKEQEESWKAEEAEEANEDEEEDKDKDADEEEEEEEDEEEEEEEEDDDDEDEEQDGDAEKEKDGKDEDEDEVETRASQRKKLKDEHNAAKQKQIDEYNAEEVEHLSKFDEKELQYRTELRKMSTRLRVDPLGVDRYHRKYYLFDTFQGIVVEPPSTFHIASLSPKKGQKKVRDDPSMSRLAMLDEYRSAGWRMLSNVKELDQLIESSNERGLREKGLKENLIINRKSIEVNMSRARGAAYSVPKTYKTAVKLNVELEKQVRKDLEDFELKLFDGALLGDEWEEKRNEWGTQLLAAKEPKDVATLLVPLLKAVPQRFIVTDMKEKTDGTFNFFRVIPQEDEEEDDEDEDEDEDAEEEHEQDKSDEMEQDNEESEDSTAAKADATDTDAVTTGSVNVTEGSKNGKAKSTADGDVDMLDAVESKDEEEEKVDEKISETETEVQAKEGEEVVEEEEELAEEEEEEELVEYTLEYATKNNHSVWLDMIDNCTGYSTYYMCLRIFEESIKWNMVLTKARCRSCRKGTDSDKILLCDSCDDGYHMYCLTPELKRVPKGNWFCPRCLANKAKAKGLPAPKKLSKKELLKQKREKDKAEKDREKEEKNREKEEVEEEAQRSMRETRKRKAAEVAETEEYTTRPKRASAKRAEEKMKVDEDDFKDDGMDENYDGDDASETGSDGAQSPSTTETSSKRKKEWLQTAVEVVKDLRTQDSAYFFLDPVRKRDVPDYFDLITEPMDLQTLVTKINRREFETAADFVRNVQLVFSNAIRYNKGDTEGEVEVCEDAATLKAYFDTTHSPKFETFMEPSTPTPTSTSSSRRASRSSTRRSTLER